MDRPGVLPGRIDNRVTLRVISLEPYSSELTAEQIGVIADIAEKYGSGTVHVTPRQTVEIPDLESSHLDEINKVLNEVGLYAGSSGRYFRNVIACSRWCLYNAIPLSDLANRLNRQFHDKVLPGKTAGSLSGCDFSCVRSRTSDIGIIARSEVELTNKECKHCSLCVKEPLGCQVDAITLTDDEVFIDTEKCVRCGFCTNVCKPETIRVKNRGFDIFVGGSGGQQPVEAQFYKTLSSEDEVMEEVDRLLNRYGEIAEEGERLKNVINRLGMKALEGNHGR